MRSMLRRLAVGCLVLLMGGLMLGSCGYHLVGHGDGTGAIPADVHSVMLVGSSASRPYLPLLRDRLQRGGYTVGATQGEVTLRVAHQPERFVPSAYDRSGVATQYRLIVSGSVELEQGGRTIWRSGNISLQDDVYVTAGLASIEASHRRLADDLHKEWVRQVWSRLRSGF